jgi:hypothetical protein
MPSKGRKKAKRTTSEQVELILRLYELRRETIMREARSFVGGPFLPKSDDELVSMVTTGSKQTGFVLQVYGYWDMVCAFVLHGMLSEPLVYDTCQEMYFQFASPINIPNYCQFVACTFQFISGNGELNTIANGEPSYLLAEDGNAPLSAGIVSAFSSVSVASP